MINLFHVFIGVILLACGGALLVHGASNHLRQTHSLPAIKRSLDVAQFRLADDSRELTREEMAEFERQHPGYIADLKARGIRVVPDYSGPERPIYAAPNP